MFSILIKPLKQVDATKHKREAFALQLLQHPEWVPVLLGIAAEDRKPLSIKAAWVLEYAAKLDLTYLYPHLDLFVKNIPKIHLDSSVRPMAKMCELLLSAYYNKKTDLNSPPFENHHLDQLCTVCFDWLISEQKVAPKAYAMSCLLLLGGGIAWVHPELRLLLEQQYPSGSAGFQARARQVLAKIA